MRIIITTDYKKVRCVNLKRGTGTRHIVDGFKINKTILKCLLIMKDLLKIVLSLIRFALRLTTQSQFYDPHHCNFI
jgi:hypothetical protein